MTMQTRSKMFWEPVSYLDGTVGGSRLITPQTHPAIAELPDPCWIVGCEITEQSAQVPAGTDAILMIKLDRGGRFCTSTGYPASEICSAAGGNDNLCNADLFRLVVLDLHQGGTRYALKQLAHPVRFSPAAGDRLMVNSSGVSAGMTMTIQVCWTLYYLVDE